MLRALVERYAAHPYLLPDGADLSPGSTDAFRSAVGYVGGMTDRFACRQAMALLDWERDRLPVGIDV
jgi:dGTPase